MDCIFCKIVNGELPTAKVYEDDSQIAFLDIFPASRGHTLLIPKKHHENIFDAREEVAKAVYPTLSLLAKAVRTATGCDGINIVQNNNAAAGQVVFHSHIHLIPRYENDEIKVTVAGKERADGAYLAEMVKQIKDALIKV